MTKAFGGSKGWNIWNKTFDDSGPIYFYLMGHIHNKKMFNVNVLIEMTKHL